MVKKMPMRIAAINSILAVGKVDCGTGDEVCAGGLEVGLADSAGTNEVIDD